MAESFDLNQTDHLLTTTRAAHKRLGSDNPFQQGNRGPVEEITYFNGRKS